MTQHLRNSFSVIAHLLPNTQNILHQLTLTQHHTLIIHNPIDIITSELNNVSQHFQHNILNSGVIMSLSDAQDKSYQLSILPRWAPDINQVNNIRTVHSYSPAQWVLPLQLARSHLDLHMRRNTTVSHSFSWLTRLRDLRPPFTPPLHHSLFLSLYGFITFCH